MPKRRRASLNMRPGHYARFVEAARRLGIAEGEGAFKDASKKTAPKPKRDDPLRLRAIFLVLVLSFPALSACKQADPNTNPYDGMDFNGAK